MNDPPVYHLIVIPPLGGTQDMLRPFLSALPSWVRTHVLQPPAFGAGENPHGWPSTRRLARAALRAWPSVSPERTVLFGVSLGGMVAQWLALDATPRMRGLILASTADRFGGFGNLRKAMRLARCFAATDESTHACLVNTMVERESPAARARACAERRPRSRKELLWLAAAAALHKAPVHKLALPCCVLIGDSDRVVPADMQTNMARRLPNAEPQHLTGVAHDVTLEAPAQTAELVASWLSQLR